MLLTKEQILGADDRQFEELDVAEWGGTIRISTMTSAERDAFEASMVPEKGKDPEAKMHNFRARFVARCIVDEDGKPMFSPRDVKQLGAKAAPVLVRVFDACRRLNGMTDQDIEELEKN